MQPVTIFLAILAWLLAIQAPAQSVRVGPDDFVPYPVANMGIAPGLQMGDPADGTPATGTDRPPPGAALLISLIARGKARGFGGMLYENRDRGHSTIPHALFPGLRHVTFDQALKGGGFDYGLADRLIFPQPLIGNSSTALTSGVRARNQTRFAMTNPLGPLKAFHQYVNNSLYIYPEHRDHDAADLFPANWPYTVTSQGSSVSDRPFIIALLMTLAAFPADTRAALEQNRLIAPALQMILRRNLKGVDSPGDYMSARAHPSAFEADALRPERMIAMAAAMRPDAVPPMVRLRVTEEDFTDAAGLAGLTERFFTTPSAIARIWRGPDWQRSIVLSAEDTEDPNGRDLTFYWTILRGNPQKITVEPLDEHGTSARITLAWHDPYPAPPLVPSDEAPRMTSRVDIAVFAGNGAYLSAPAFLSVSFPTHERRHYAAGPDGAVRLMSADYDAAGRGDYYDSLLHFSAPWTDRFLYDDAGALAGVERTGTAGSLTLGPDGKTPQGQIVVHEPVPDRSGASVLGYRLEDQ